MSSKQSVRADNITNLPPELPKRSKVRTSHIANGSHNESVPSQMSEKNLHRQDRSDSSSKDSGYKSKTPSSLSSANSAIISAHPKSKLQSTIPASLPVPDTSTWIEGAGYTVIEPAMDPSGAELLPSPTPRGWSKTPSNFGKLDYKILADKYGLKLPTPLILRNDRDGNPLVYLLAMENTYFYWFSRTKVLNHIYQPYTPYGILDRMQSSGSYVKCKKVEMQEPPRCARVHADYIADGWSNDANSLLSVYDRTSISQYRLPRPTLYLSKHSANWFLLFGWGQKTYVYDLNEDTLCTILAPQARVMAFALVIYAGVQALTTEPVNLEPAFVASYSIPSSDVPPGWSKIEGHPWNHKGLDVCQEILYHRDRHACLVEAKGGYWEVFPKAGIVYEIWERCGLQAILEDMINPAKQLTLIPHLFEPQ